MNIHSDAMWTDTSQVEAMYSEKDNCDVRYVCTTTLPILGDSVMDIYHSPKQHPEFGNNYFGLFMNQSGSMMIANADSVEKLKFDLVMNDKGYYEYSRHRHDFKSFKNGNFIDGGRDYTRTTGLAEILTAKVCRGQFKIIESSNIPAKECSGL